MKRISLHISVLVGWLALRARERALLSVADRQCGGAVESWLRERERERALDGNVGEEQMSGEGRKRVQPPSRGLSSLRDF